MTDERSDRLRSLAEAEALLRLGLLDEAEAQAHVRALADADDEEQAAVRAGRATVAAIGLSAPDVEPPAGARDRFLARMRSVTRPPAPTVENQVWRAWTPEGAAESSPGMVYVPGAGSDWEETGFEGIVARRLFVDPTGGNVTMLVRMAAGTSYPGHRHGGAEECFVLEGDLHTGDVHMHAGDYQRAGEGSVHGDQWTEGGCLLLLRSSQSDEFV